MKATNKKEKSAAQPGRAARFTLAKSSQGLEQLLRIIHLTKTDAEILSEAREALEKIPENMIQRMIALGIQLLREHLEIPKVQNNLMHVEDQLLRPVIEDGDELAGWFGIDPLRLRLLVVLHDLGKVEIPEPMLTVLTALFPDDFVAREILTHEYASMHWVEVIGKQLTFSENEILALQRLIANHNFGPDLCSPRHKALREHWWPHNFRAKVMPKLVEHGVDLSAIYHKSEDGVFQYNHAEDDVYAALLAAYDRALANRYNEFGLETWQKFAQQDYSEWQKIVEKNPKTPTCFHARAITESMEHAATWAEAQVRAMWAVLSDKHVLNARRSEFILENFGPFRRQIDGLQRLQQIIHTIKALNEGEKDGALSYRTSTGERFRVEEDPAKSKLFWWDPNATTWKLVALDRSPVKLFFEMLKNDF